MTGIISDAGPAKSKHDVAHRQEGAYYCWQQGHRSCYCPTFHCGGRAGRHYWSRPADARASEMTKGQIRQLLTYLLANRTDSPARSEHALNTCEQPLPPHGTVARRP